MIKGVIFNLDNVLYDTTLQKDTARINALKAMVEAGLPIDMENAFSLLKKIVEKYGVDDDRHFDRLLEKLGMTWNPRVIAAGVVAYRETSSIYLQPFPDTLPTIIKLRDRGLRLGLLSNGNPVKQWQKLIKLGMQHLFHEVLMAAEKGKKKVDEELFNLLVDSLETRGNETMFVGGNLEEGMASANRLGLITVRIRRGSFQSEEPLKEEMKPRYEIRSFTELLPLITTL